MKTLPSKELLSKVLKKKISDSKNFSLCLKKNVLEYGKVEKYGIHREDINIYELDHKCKEWALSKGYVIIQDTRGYTKVYRFPNGEIKIWEDENMNSSIDRTFNACEWIIERTK